MVIYGCNLTEDEITHYLNCIVLLERGAVGKHYKNKRKLIGRLRLPPNHNYKKGSKFGRYNEIIIDNKVLRVHINQLLGISNGFYNGQCFEFLTPTKRRSILKYSKELNDTPKSVKFNDKIIVTPISPRRVSNYSDDDVLYVEDSDDNERPGEFKNSILQSNKKINSSYIRQRKQAKMTTEEEIKQVEDVKIETIKTEFKIETENIPENVTFIPIESILNKVEPVQQIQYIKVEEIPKRKRGRPRKNQPDPDPPFSPFSTPKKKPYLTQKKSLFSDPNEPKRKRGRPRKKVEFNFHNIVSDINMINLPSDLWSAHVSVTSKRSQICFTRVVQAVSDSVPVECDKSVKFVGGKNFFVKMNSRLVELVGAPKTVESLKDVEILLEIVNDLNINDPVLRYYVR